ncbi:hypothetical protein KHC28_24210 [Ancylobacter sonchi]|uniref:hypothetical protein n=1 Tax=Ancylobacter sonchi TaxID=1937790 RepID=UPI001BD4A81F|nr:hypothetical protein [Ancylobacter sonchi]MBS7536753.1 hypothetical protein [Ancylobacter sonchi]
MIVPSIPLGHLTFLVDNEAFYPLLRRGEFAIVDLSDHQPRHGEIFMIAYHNKLREHLLSFTPCQLRRRGGFWSESQRCMSHRHHADDAEPIDMWYVSH